MKFHTLLLGLCVFAFSYLAHGSTTHPFLSVRSDPIPEVPATALQLPVSGLLADGRNFVGTLAVTKFDLDSTGQLLVTGVLSGMAGEGSERQWIEQLVEAIAAILQASSVGCDVLTLDLGPLNLDVLGLVVDLSPVNLDVIAQPGAGNLVGNLLCAVAHLLDNPLANLLGLNAILNQINDILDGA